MSAFVREELKLRAVRSREHAAARRAEAAKSPMLRGLAEASPSSGGHTAMPFRAQQQARFELFRRALKAERAAEKRTGRTSK